MDRTIKKTNTYTVANDITAIYKNNYKFQTPKQKLKSTILFYSFVITFFTVITILLTLAMIYSVNQY